MLLGKEKSWLPAVGNRELMFTDNGNNTHVFRINAIDKTELVVNECDENYQIQYIKTTLYLNDARTDSIHLALRSSNWLCLNAYSKGEPNIVMCDIFAKSGQGKSAKRLSNVNIGNHQYPDVILLLHNEGYSNGIDSLFIADRSGIVGFQYDGVNYVLE